MYEKSKMKTGREGRRLETQKHQREAKGQFHPRGLARSVAHSRMTYAGMEQLNKTHSGQTSSTFSQKWRGIAATMAKD